MMSKTTMFHISKKLDWKIGEIITCGKEYNPLPFNNLQNIFIPMFFNQHTLLTEGSILLAPLYLQPYRTTVQEDHKHHLIFL